MASSCKSQHLKNLNSGLNSPVQTETTIKRKLFARKPAFVNVVANLDKKRKATQKQFSISFNITPQISRLSTEKYQNTQAFLTDRRYRQTQNFTKDKISQGSIQKSSPTLEFTPKAERKNTFSRSFYLPKKQNKYQTDYSSNVEISKQSGMNNNSPRNSDRKSRSRFHTLNDERKEQNTINNGEHQTTTSIELNKSLIIKETSHSREGSTNKKANPDKSMNQQCCYCDNNKKILDILNQKYFKLEEQYSHKVLNLKQLTDKNQKLTKETIHLREQLDASQSRFYSTEIDFFKSKDELTYRIEALKKELIKANQKIKYNQIENIMLLRLKNQHQQLNRDYQKLKFQNQRLKRQSLESAKLEQANFRKGKMSLKGKQGKMQDKLNNKKDSAFINANTISSQKNLHKPSNIYYDCEDDNISLNFSQHSQDHY